MFRIQYVGEYEFLYNLSAVYESEEAAKAAFPPIHSEDRSSYYTRRDYYPEGAPLFKAYKMSAFDAMRHVTDFSSFAQNPWRNERNIVRYISKDMYIHPDPENNALVRFWDFGAERWTSMKPGKFLKKFFEGTFTDRQIDFYSEFWRSGERPMPAVNFAIAMTEEEMVWVYKHGPQSCMKGFDAVKVYAAGDLGLGYLTDEQGRVMARALCWPERKIYGRVYPTEGRADSDRILYESEEVLQSMRNALIKKFRDDGYSSLAENPAGLDGARIRYIKHENGAVMPYLDNNLKLQITDSSAGHFTVSRDPLAIAAGTTSGYMSIQWQTCHHCKVEAMSGSAQPQVNRNWKNFNTSGGTRVHVCTACNNLETPASWRDSDGIWWLTKGNTPINALTQDLPTNHPDYSRYMKKIHPESDAARRIWVSDGNGLSYHGRYVAAQILPNGKKYAPSELIEYPRWSGQYFLKDSSEHIQAKKDAAKVRLKLKAEQAQAQLGWLKEDKSYYDKHGEYETSKRISAQIMTAGMKASLAAKKASLQTRNEQLNSLRGSTFNVG